MKVYKDRGYILRRKNFSENDTLVVVFSKNYGKLQLLAKGSRKFKSKFLGHLEPFSLIKFEAASGKSFDILTSVEIEESYLRLKSDLVNLPSLSYLFEVTELLTSDHQKNESIFNLMEIVLNSPCWQNNQDELLAFYLFNLLGLSGFLPEIDVCSKCHSMGSFNHFSFYWGGLICQNCSTASEYKKVDIELLNNLRKIKQESLKIIDKGCYLESVIKTGQKEKKQIRKLLNDFISYINEKKLKSSKYLDYEKNKKH